MNLLNCLKGTAILAAGIALCSCGGGGGGGGSASSNVTLRFFNSVPDSTALDFAVNDTVDGKALTYNGSTPNFLTVPPANYDLSITEHGQTQSLWAVTANLTANSDYAIVALGQEGYGSETLKRPQILVVPVSRVAPNGSKSQLYIVNAFEESAGSPTPSIDFTNPGQNPLFSALGIAPANSTSLVVDSGSQDFLVRQNGSEGNYVEQTFNFAPGSINLMIVSGVNGGSGAQAPEILQIPIQTK